MPRFFLQTNPPSQSPRKKITKPMMTWADMMSFLQTWRRLVDALFIVEGYIYIHIGNPPKKVDRNFHFFPKRCCAPARIILLMDGGIWDHFLGGKRYQDGWIAARKGQQTTLNFHNKKSHPKLWNCDKMFLCGLPNGIVGPMLAERQPFSGGLRKPQCDPQRSSESHPPCLNRFPN